MRKFYAALPTGSLVGIESTGYAQWFQCLLVELGHQLWIGDAAEIRAASVRQQKTDTRDARFLLQLLLEHRFPRLWLPSPEDRETRRLLLHRVKLVRMRTMVRNQLHALAMNQGLRRRRKLCGLSETNTKSRHYHSALPLPAKTGRVRNADHGRKQVTE